ncbi:MAG: Rho termination factor N-terminal domain-containing protein [Aeromicrobium sp.]
MAPKDTKNPTKTERLAAANARVEELTAQVAALRTRVRSLETEADTWRKRAEKQTSRVQKVKDQAEKAIAEATSLAKKRARAKADKRIRQAIADHVRDDRPRAEPLALKDAPALPEASWTVAQLRTAARDQGVPGYSRLRKDQLLAALF